MTNLAVQSEADAGTVVLARKEVLESCSGAWVRRSVRPMSGLRRSRDSVEKLLARLQLTVARLPNRDPKGARSGGAYQRLLHGPEARRVPTSSDCTGQTTSCV